MHECIPVTKLLIINIFPCDYICALTQFLVNISLAKEKKSRMIPEFVSESS